MRHAHRPERLRYGFTVVELSVALVVVIILTGLALPAIMRSRERANELSCLNNLKQLALAVHHYHADKRQMPPYASGRMHEIHGGWFVFLSPYAEYDGAYERFVNRQRGESNGLSFATDGRFSPDSTNLQFPMLLCRSDPSRYAARHENLTNYVANWYAWGNGVGGAYGPAQRFESMTDGLSSVVLFAEAYASCDGLNRLAFFSSYFHNFGITQQGRPSDDPSYLPNDYTMFQVQPDNCNMWRAQTAHALMPAALADGSVRFVSPSISPTTWKAALKPRDGSPLGTDW